MEDAYSLATCLQIAGKNHVSLATKVHNHLRYVAIKPWEKKLWRPGFSARSRIIREGRNVRRYRR